MLELWWPTDRDGESLEDGSVTAELRKQQRTRRPTRDKDPRPSERFLTHVARHRADFVSQTRPWRGTAGSGVIAHEMGTVNTDVRATGVDTKD